MMYYFAIPVGTGVAKQLDADDILTIKQLASYLQLNERTVYRLAADGRLPAFRVGGSWRFRRADINHWIDAQAGRGESARRVKAARQHQPGSGQ